MNLPPFGTAFKCQTNGGAVDRQTAAANRFLSSFPRGGVRPALTPFVTVADPLTRERHRPTFIVAA